MRGDRKCVTLHQRGKDETIEDTKYAIENVIALMCSERIAKGFNHRRKWEIDCVRFLLGFTTAREEIDFGKLTQDHLTLCNEKYSVRKKIGKAMTAVLRHQHKAEMDQKGALPMSVLFGELSNSSNPLVQRADGRIFAAMLNGNDKQRFYVDIYLYDTWFPQDYDMPWDIFIGCHQGHSTNVALPSEIAHQLTEFECLSMGWIFHVTDKKFENSIYADGLVRRGRDALHFMYENDGSPDYVPKGAGTRKPRIYDSTIYCVLNIPDDALWS